MNTETAIKFAEMQSFIKDLEQTAFEAVELYKEENDYDDIKSQVLDEMLADKQKTIPTKYGNVTVRETKTYEYPDFFVQETDQYKLHKKEVEKDLKIRGKYSVNVSLQLAGKPKEIETKPANHKGT